MSAASRSLALARGPLSSVASSRPSFFRTLSAATSQYATNHQRHIPASIQHFTSIPLSQLHRQQHRQQPLSCTTHLHVASSSIRRFSATAPTTIRLPSPTNSLPKPTSLPISASTASSTPLADMIKGSLETLWKYNSSFAARVSKNAPAGMSPINRDTDILSYASYVARGPTRSARHVPLNTPPAIAASGLSYDYYPPVRSMTTQKEKGKSRSFMVCIGESSISC